MKIRTRIAAIGAVLAVPIGTLAAGSLLLPAEPEVASTNHIVRLTARDPAQVSISDHVVATPAEAVGGNAEKQFEGFGS